MILPLIDKLIKQSNLEAAKKLVIQASLEHPNDAELAKRRTLLDLAATSL